MKVLISDALAPAAAEFLTKSGHEVTVKTGLKPDELIATLKGQRALLVRGATKVTADVIAASPDLKVIARAGTGLDNIDVKAAKAAGITVLNTPAANAISVAELTMGLMLALDRHLVPAGTDLRAGKWEKTKYMGRELCGKTLALVGFGRIGREVALRARAFGMQVSAFDPAIDAWPAGFMWATPAASLESLLLAADYVSLHVPLTPETKNLIGAQQLALMHKDAVLINCARGGTVDEAALFHALSTGTLRGAALDVFATEPTGENPLLTLPNVIATPHLGASTLEAQDRAGMEAAELVVEALKKLGE
jgi:D-3-phosphoglycerate dehydrogenase / 2-oxoglutarate reductase